jgi:mitotic spindle assembly checkpoint protein MAD2B
MPVFQSRHPVLNTYISGAVKAIGEELTLVSVSRVLATFFELRWQGHVDKVIGVIKNKENERC